MRLEDLHGSEIEFRQIPVQVGAIAMLIDATHTALEHAEDPVTHLR
jgi:hypothetical protein